MARRLLMKVNSIFRWRSLRTRVTLLTLAIFLVGIWSLTFYASLMLREDIQQLLAVQQYSTVSLIAKDINTELDNRLGLLEQVATKITPTILGRETSMQTFLEDRPALASMFNGGIFVTRLDGTAIADFPTSTRRVGINYRDRDYIIGAFNGKSTIGKPVMGRVLKAPVIVMSAPVRDAKGKVIGALAGVINLGMPNFLDRITESKYGKTGGFVVVSPRHRLIITATDKSRIMEESPAPGAIPLIDRFMQGYEGTGILVNPRGVEVLQSAKSIPVARWYVAAQLPTAEAFAPIKEMQQQMMLAAVFFTLLASGLVWWVLRRQLEPAFSAIKTLATLSDTSKPLHITRQDEIGELIGAFNDLLKTLEKRAAALKESEERHRRIIETLSDAFLLRTGDTIVYANQAALKLFRANEVEDLIGRRYLDLVHPDDRALSAERIRKNIDEDSITAPREHRILTLDGQVVDVESSGGPVKYGGETQNFGVYRDITDRKRAEKEREKLQDQLLQSQKMESVGRLAGGVAHDFNNMLGVILGHAEMALEETDPSQSLHADLEEIRRAANRSADLTKQLLAFARKQTVSPKVLDLNETVEGMLKMLRRLIGEDIQLAWLPGANLWPAKIDPSQIDQILANLSVNSRDAISGLGKVTIETQNVHCDEAYCVDHAGCVPGDYVLLAVSDDGCGMDRETQGKLFEPFFTTKETGKGTGLGLATVYGIVSQNNGFIDVYSEPGQGTTFKIYLPRHIGKTEHVSTEILQKPSTIGHETILIVEDEPALLELSCSMLERQGYRVLAAATPGEAIRLAEEYSDEIHLLVTDVVMPEMNGRELARKMLSLCPNMRRLFMSGYTADVIAHHGVLDDGVHFLQKPFSKPALAAKVREALEGK